MLVHVFQSISRRRVHAASCNGTRGEYCVKIGYKTAEWQGRITAGIGRCTVVALAAYCCHQTTNHYRVAYVLRISFAKYTKSVDVYIRIRLLVMHTFVPLRYVTLRYATHHFDRLGNRIAAAARKIVWTAGVRNRGVTRAASLPTRMISDPDSRTDFHRFDVPTATRRSIDCTVA